MTLWKFTGLVKLVLPCAGGITIVTVGHCGEAALVSSAVKLLKRLEKVLSAV